MGDVLELVAEMTEILNDYEPWLDEDLTEQELESSFSLGFDPELVIHARDRYFEIQDQLDL